MPVLPEMGDIGPTIEHSGRALLRHIVSKSPKPMVGCVGRVVGGVTSGAALVIFSTDFTR